MINEYDSLIILTDVMKISRHTYWVSSFKRLTFYYEQVKYCYKYFVWSYSVQSALNRFVK